MVHDYSSIPPPTPTSIWKFCLLLKSHLSFKSLENERKLSQFHIWQIGYMYIECCSLKCELHLVCPPYQSQFYNCQLNWVQKQLSLLIIIICVDTLKSIYRNNVWDNKGLFVNCPDAFCVRCWLCHCRLKFLYSQLAIITKLGCSIIDTDTIYSAILLIDTSAMHDTTRFIR